MTVHLDAHVARPALALNLELSHGRPGASARVELHDRVAADAGRSPGVSRLARVALRGCIDAVAARRLEQVLDDLASRGVEQVLVDCVELRHIDFRMVPALVAALDRFEARSGGVVLCGLSRYLRDLFRMAGCESRLRCWPSAADLLATGAAAPEPGRECAS
ncbi:MAG: STAS domain-containing protein [Candidatus Eisenbacteria bacterium]